MSYNLQAITRAWVAKLADAQDSGSCEQYAHVGSSPVPRTTKPRYSIGCAEVLFLWHIRSRRDLNGRKRQQSIRIVAPPRRDSADNATLHGRFVILCRARNYYRLSSGASPVPRTIVAARRTPQQLPGYRGAVCFYTLRLLFASQKCKTFTRSSFFASLQNYRPFTHFCSAELILPRFCFYGVLVRGGT